MQSLAQSHQKTKMLFHQDNTSDKCPFLGWETPWAVHTLLRTSLQGTLQLSVTCQWWLLAELTQWVPELGQQLP